MREVYARRDGIGPNAVPLALKLIARFRLTLVGGVARRYAVRRPPGKVALDYRCPCCVFWLSLALWSRSLGFAVPPKRTQPYAIIAPLGNLYPD